jgi:hypothetical protein
MSENTANEELVERMKGNLTAFVGLAEAEAKCLAENSEHVEFMGGGGEWVRNRNYGFMSNDILRISPDYKPEPVVVPPVKVYAESVERLNWLRNDLNLIIRELGQ